MKIYLAGPFFNEEERKNIEEARDILRARGFDVFVPMEHKVENGENMPNEQWGKAVFELDKKAIYQTDVVVAIYYGLYSDSGTAWEIGFTNCLGKKIVIVHIDTNQESSLMIVNGCDVNLKQISDLKEYDFEKLEKTNFKSHKPQK